MATPILQHSEQVIENLTKKLHYYLNSYQCIMIIFCAQQIHFNKSYKNIYHIPTTLV